MINSSRQPYQGEQISLVISIYLGTTYSHVAWALLEPNQVPQTHIVTGFIGLEDCPSSAAIPSVLFYDQEGRLRAAGTQTLDYEIIFQAHSENWIRTEWFILLLYRDSYPELGNAPQPTLPRCKTVVDVVGDYLRYIASSAQKHFLERASNSADIWELVKDRIQYVISHPKGWRTTQLSQLHKAATLAGFVALNKGSRRLHFVSEGKASLLWWFRDHAGIEDDIKVGNRFIITDAGGGPIIISSFDTTCLDSQHLRLTEANPPCSFLAGSVFVTHAFKQFLEEKLASGGSVYGDPESIEIMISNFDAQVKRTFRHSDRKSAVIFGSYRENEPAFSILAGRFIVEGADMVRFFEPSCEAAERGIRQHVIREGTSIVLVIGELAAIPWFFSEIQRRLQDLPIQFFRSDTPAGDTISQGGIQFYLDCGPFEDLSPG
ncbi:hypothetical protein FRC02_003321 [Tulasnella sp. 418]|nr:hypothetical protein FRC02_003321 [Tulasnella sp. 418]